MNNQDQPKTEIAVSITATKSFTFEAAHFLEGYNGKCGHLHGHSYTAEVTVFRQASEMPTTGQQAGMVMDLTEVKSALQPVIDLLDHSVIVEREISWGLLEGEIVDCPVSEPRVFVLGARPTAENIAMFLFGFANDRLNEVTDGEIGVYCVRLKETNTSWVTVGRA